ncbi:hypothetical protein C2845_PM06G13640 [Panicum miliaceum]|uniref:RING-type domain-containing protein n=1 Tax=Panicum miliaceum TaxID=4540 RepID=A0A3L6RAT7_PANMI|nr:hypothetical protein C2845_PM06G13640 [Panicum miliaceum]
MDDAEIRRERDALQSRIDELSEAQRRLIEIEEAAARIHDAHYFAQSPVVASDDDQLACAGGAVSSVVNAGSLRRDPVAVASGDRQDPDDLYPLLPFDEPAEEHDATPQLVALEEPEDEYRPLRWDYWDGEVHHHAVHNQAAVHATSAGQQPTPGEAAGSGDHSGHLLFPDPELYYDVVQNGGEATPVRFSDGGFGGVPASAAAIAGLKKQRYDDGPPGADDDMCVICMRGYKKGKRLYVMPCAYKHRFHRKCLKKWLSRSHLCPLCRHALPTEDQAAHRNAVWLLNNVNLNQGQ